MSKSEIDAVTERRLQRIEQALALRPELSRARMWQGKGVSWSSGRSVVIGRQASSNVGANVGGGTIRQKEY